MERAAIVRQKTKPELNVKRTFIKRNSNLQSQCYFVDNLKQDDITTQIKAPRLETPMLTLARPDTSHHGYLETIHKENQTMSDGSLFNQQRRSMDRDRSNNLSPHEGQSMLIEHAIPVQHAQAASHILLSAALPESTELGLPINSTGKSLTMCLENNRPRSQMLNNINSAFYNVDTTAGHGEQLLHIGGDTEAEKKTYTNNQIGHLHSCSYEKSQDKNIPRQNNVNNYLTDIRNIEEAHEKSVEEQDKANTQLSMSISQPQFSSIPAPTCSLKRIPCYKSGISKDTHYKLQNRVDGDRSAPIMHMDNSSPKEHIMAFAQKSAQGLPAYSPTHVAGRIRKYNYPNKMCSSKTQTTNYFSSQLPYNVVNVAALDECIESQPECIHFIGAQNKGTICNVSCSKRSKNLDNLPHKYVMQDSHTDKFSRCHSIKAMVSGETQYSEADVNSLPIKLNSSSENNKTSQTKESQNIFNETGYRNNRTLTLQSEQETGTAVGSSVFSKCGADALETKIPPNCKNANKGEAADKSYVTSESSQCGFKCESFLKEILKEVAEKISRPTFQKNTVDNSANSKQRTETSAQSDNLSKSKRAHDIRFKQRCAESPLRNEVSKIPVPTSNEIRLPIPTSSSIVIQSYEYEELQYGTNSSQIDKERPENKDPSPEHSTVSLEVKSVKLSFCCADKHIQNNSRQIRIKCSLSPNSKSRWKAESIIVDSPTENSEKTDSLNQEKLSSTNVSEKKYEGKPLVNKDRKEHGTRSGAVKNSKIVITCDACEQTSVLHKFTSPDAALTERGKRMPTRPSDTTLRSPSPYQTNMCPGGKRNSSSSQNIQSDKYFTTNNQVSNKCFNCYLPILENCAGMTNHSLGMVSNGHSGSTNELLHRKNSLLWTHSKTQYTCHVVDHIARYKHKCATKILAKHPENNLVPRTEDRYLMLQLDWGVFIIVMTTIPTVLLLLALNFYFRVPMTTGTT